MPVARTRAWPIGVEYELPPTIPSDVVVVGDLHSHVYESPSPSGVDRYDETHRAGLHIVIGRLDLEPPQFHAELVVDGVRFRAEPSLVIAGYERRSDHVPRRWLDRVHIKTLRPEPRWAADPDTPDTEQPGHIWEQRDLRSGD